MNWFEPIDGYCERTGPEFWSEPVNFLTNFAFLFAAVVMWYRCRNDPHSRALCLILGAIGTGSALFHSYAEVWAAVADVVPILIFVLVYIYFANRFFWKMSPRWSALGAMLFFPYVYATLPVLSSLPIINKSVEYIPIAVLIALYAVALRNRLKGVAHGLGIGALILFVSIGFRSVDEPLCDWVQSGTHFIWHILNAIMLAWMIEVLRKYKRFEQA